MPKKEHKKTDTKVKDAKFIKFSEIQAKYLNEVRARTVNEFNTAVDAVCEELGIIEKLKQAPAGMYKLRLDDLSGLDIFPAPPKPPSGPPKDPPQDPLTKPPGKSRKDN